MGGDRSRRPSACAGCYPRPEWDNPAGGLHPQRLHVHTLVTSEPSPLAVAGRPSARHRAADRRFHAAAPAARRRRATAAAGGVLLELEPAPDWSYFDHPPLATYAIWLTTHVFGQTGFGIKSAAVLWALGWNLLWARLVLDLYGDRRLAFWSLAALNLMTLMYGPTRSGRRPTPARLRLDRRAVVRLAPEPDRRRPLVVRGGPVHRAVLGRQVLGRAAVADHLPLPARVAAPAPLAAAPQPWLATVLAVADVHAGAVVERAARAGVVAFQSSRRSARWAASSRATFLMLVGTQLALLTPYVFALAIGALARGAGQAFRALAALDDRDRLLLLRAPCRS